MNVLRISLGAYKNSPIKNSVSLPLIRFFREFSDDAESSKFILEKSVNRVTLLGRVGSTPQLRGTEIKPVVLFTLATNTNFKYESGEVQQKTEWHRISVFKPYLRKVVLDYLKKGSRVYVDGRLLYGELVDPSGTTYSTTTIVANDVIFLSASRKDAAEEEMEKDPDSSI